MSVGVSACQPVLAHVTRMLAHVAACRPVLPHVGACLLGLRAPQAPEPFS